MHALFQTAPGPYPAIFKRQTSLDILFSSCHIPHLAQVKTKSAFICRHHLNENREFAS
jgi:hypothetical protein